MWLASKLFLTADTATGIDRFSTPMLATRRENLSPHAVQSRHTTIGFRSAKKANNCSDSNQLSNRSLRKNRYKRLTALGNPIVLCAASTEAMAKLLACAASNSAETIDRQVFCCERRNTLNNFTKIGYFISKFIVLLLIYKLFVAELLIAQTMNFFPFLLFKSDKRSDQK